MKQKISKYQPITTRTINIIQPRSIDIRSKYFLKHKIHKIGELAIPLHYSYGKNIADYTFSNDVSIPMIWGCAGRKKQYSHSLKKHNIQFNRPGHFLRTYLIRKSRIGFGPEINPQCVLEQQHLSSKNTHDFRIKKLKKNLYVIDPNIQNNFKQQSKPQQESLQSLFNGDFITFNNSKSIYQMTKEELQQSIRWKKCYLDILTKKWHGNQEIKVEIQDKL